MFDSPIEMCPVCGEWVLTDQTQKECAREHRCGAADCPLERCFTGFDFRLPKAAHEARVLGKRSRHQ
ncbi:MAG TPA: hypothetical protein VFP70_08285 [Burkholderiales bacterium]|nr:hypothetical protein [Burkholderiales bacterium]